METKKKKLYTVKHIHEKRDIMKTLESSAEASQKKKRATGMSTYNTATV